MLAVITKWQKNDVLSIPWPETQKMHSEYSLDNLPPGFTANEYTLFLQYIEKIQGIISSSNIVADLAQRDVNHNLINVKVFLDENEYNNYKLISDRGSVEREQLLSVFKLTRTIKIITDEPQIINIITNNLTYEQLDNIISN